MVRGFWVFIATLHLTLACGCLPAPPAYDHAMLRPYFGQSPADVEAFLGKPSKIGDSQTHAANNKEENLEAESALSHMTYTYLTPDGDLIFYFNGKDQVDAIQYAGNNVAP